MDVRNSAVVDALHCVVVDAPIRHIGRERVSGSSHNRTLFWNRIPGRKKLRMGQPRTMSETDRIASAESEPISSTQPLTKLPLVDRGHLALLEVA